MIKRKVLTLAATAAFVVATAALARPGVDMNQANEMFQYGDSMYMWDPESGGAVRVAAVWDGFMPSSGANTLVQEGDYIVQRDAQSGETVRVGAVWDGRIANDDSAMASKRGAVVSALALTR